MREILFKAKRVDNGQWVEGYYLQDKMLNSKFIKDRTQHLIATLKKETLSETIKTGFYEIDYKTLSEYTGIKDKNGNKIFENDIVKLNIQLQGYSSGELDDDLLFFGHIIGYVRFMPCKGFYLQSALIYDEIIEEKRKHNTKKNIVSYRSEVIGNKFDNPELLEKVEE